jgi:transcriptional regulator with XRE-family HTH domain
MTKNDTQDYRTELKVLVLRTGLKQHELARRLGVGRAYLSRVLNGHLAGYRVRARLVREFGFPAWILDDAPWKRAA